MRKNGPIIRLNKFEMEQLSTIAKFYGAKVEFSTGNIEGFYDTKGTITLKIIGEFNRIISVFCHELGHHKNRLQGKYPLYHNLDTLLKIEKILGSDEKAVEYALKAELYTEKVGEQICKEWFPEVKFIPFYKNDKFCRGYLMGAMGF